MTEGKKNALLHALNMVLLLIGLAAVYSLATQTVEAFDRPSHKVRYP